MAGLDTWAFEQTADPEIQAALHEFTAHQHFSWLYDINDGAWCDARTGAVVTSSGRFLRRSSTYWQLHEQPSLSMLRSFGKRRLLREVTRLPLAASVRDPVDLNFWHFHDDVLSRLVMLDENGFAPDIPLLISPALHDSRFFRHLRRRGELADRNWVRHDGLVYADRLVVPIRGSLRASTVKGVQRLLGSAPVAASSEKIFLVRSSERSRYITNQAEVEEALGPLRVVDADLLSVQEQIELFQNAGTVVAAHGAGLTNLMHRAGAPCNVIELFPSNYIRPHFAQLARAHGFTWRAVICGPVTDDGGFSVNSAARARLREFVAEAV